MRTKALLGLAALAVSTLVVSAQTPVYSLNVVGYVNIALPASTVGNGVAIIASPLNTSNNFLSEIIPTAPVNTKIYRYSGPTLLATYFYAPDDDNNINWGGDASAVIKPGEGFWIQNPGAATNITFVGEVAQGNLTNNIPAGISLKSSIVPQGGQLDTVLGYPAVVNSTKIYRYLPGSGYLTSIYGLDDDNNPAWDLIPTLSVGEGFWASETAARQWIRNFTVN